LSRGRLNHRGPEVRKVLRDSSWQAAALPAPLRPASAIFGPLRPAAVPGYNTSYGMESAAAAAVSSLPEIGGNNGAGPSTLWTGSLPRLR